jgi:hypothetical protein
LLPMRPQPNPPIGQASLAGESGSKLPHTTWRPNFSSQIAVVYGTTGERYAGGERCAARAGAHPRDPHCIPQRPFRRRIRLWTGL